MLHNMIESRRYYILVLLLALAHSSCSWKDQRETVTIQDQQQEEYAESFVTAMPSGNIELPGYGKELSLMYGPIEGSGGNVVSGVSTVHFLENGFSVVGMQLNIPVPDDGEFYEAHLLDPARGLSVEIGHLQNPF